MCQRSHCFSERDVHLQQQVLGMQGMLRLQGLDHKRLSIKLSVGSDHREWLP